MDEKHDSKKVDLLKMIEDRLDEFSRRITKIEDKVSEIDEKTKNSFLNFQSYVNLLNNLIYTDIIILSEIERLRTWKAGNTSFFDIVMGYIKEKYGILMEMEKLGFRPGTLTISSQVVQIITISKIWNLPFEELGSYLIKTLGKNLARRIVDKSDLMQYYGKHVIPIWDSLTSE